MAIPGLSFVPVDCKEEHFEISTFNNQKFSIPHSHITGNSRPISDLVNLGTIYKGSYATFYKCKTRFDPKNVAKVEKIYAVKRYEFKLDNSNNGVPVSFIREQNICRILKHDNIVNCHEVLAGNTIKSNFLLLDFCVTSLQELIEKDCKAIYDEDVVKYMMRQLFEGIDYLQESLVIHRNISSGNILFTESGTLKISGFRKVRFYEKGLKPSVLTELTFKAPEMLLKAEYGLPVDIWSAGCVFAQLLLKKPLFSGDSELEVLNSIFDVLGTPSESIWPGFKKLISGDDEFHRKELKNEFPYSDLRNILVGAPQSSVELLEDLLIYYPCVRLKSSQVLKYDYMTKTPDFSRKLLMCIISTAELIDKPQTKR